MYPERARLAQWSLILGLVAAVALAFGSGGLAASPVPAPPGGQATLEELERMPKIDKYPNMAVDTAARVVHFQVQEREKVRNFLIKYQDRVLYGTDHEIGPGQTEARLRRLDEAYRHDYRYFGTDQEMDAPAVKPGLRVRGLALPLSVLKKIYYENALKWYPGI